MFIQSLNYEIASNHFHSGHKDIQIVSDIMIRDFVFTYLK